MSETKVSFDDMKEPINTKFINTAGIHRGMKIIKFDYMPATFKKDKDGKDTDEQKSGASFELQLESKDGQFNHRYWELSTDPSKIKYTDKKYDASGAEIGTKTPEEQIQSNFEELAYNLIQLGMALGNPFDNVKRIVTGNTKWKDMMEAFKKAFITDAVLKDCPPIEVKLVWKNNDFKKTSFLNIPKANFRSMVFFKDNPKNTDPELQLSKYEIEKCSKAKYQRVAPTTDDTEVEDLTSSAPKADIAKDDLF